MGCLEIWLDAPLWVRRGRLVCLLPKVLDMQLRHLRPATFKAGVWRWQLIGSVQLELWSDAGVRELVGIRSGQHEGVWVHLGIQTWVPAAVIAHAWQPGAAVDVGQRVSLSAVLGLAHRGVEGRRRPCPA